MLTIRDIITELHLTLPIGETSFKQVGNGKHEPLANLPITLRADGPKRWISLRKRLVKLSKTDSSNQ